MIAGAPRVHFVEVGSFMYPSVNAGRGGWRAAASALGASETSLNGLDAVQLGGLETKPSRVLRYSTAQSYVVRCYRGLSSFFLSLFPVRASVGASDSEHLRGCVDGGTRGRRKEAARVPGTARHTYV